MCREQCEIVNAYGTFCNLTSVNCQIRCSSRSIASILEFCNLSSSQGNIPEADFVAYNLVLFTIVVGEEENIVAQCPVVLTLCGACSGSLTNLCAIDINSCNVVHAYEYYAVCCA